MADTQQVVTHFELPETVTQIAALGEGFINDTFVVTTSGNKYILQRKNKTVFPDIPGMMDNIAKVTEHIRKKAVLAGKDPLRATLQLVKTRDGRYYYVDPQGDFWTCCVSIENSITHQTADTLELVTAGGEGLGQFQELLADFPGTLSDTLPGFHNIRYRFEQFDLSVARNAAQRTVGLKAEIAAVYQRKERMLDFYRKIETGEIPRRVSHNDTKLSNFLFDKEGNVLCAIDLDTVMQSSVLFDFGDAIRSYANTAAEDEPNLKKVSVDLARYTAFSLGYLSRANRFLCPAEKEHLAFSALYITFEQYLRFLMDYIDGDTYYKTSYPHHNLVRALCQLALLQSMETQYPKMQEIINNIQL